MHEMEMHKDSWIIRLLREKYGLPLEYANKLLLPQIGETLEHRGIVYKVVYIKQNPLSFSATPISVNIAPKSEFKLRMLGMLSKIRGMLKS